MIKLGPEEIAKYPFVEDAGSYIRDLGFTLDMLGTDPDMRVFIDTAMKRIRTAADGGVYETLPNAPDKRRIMIETLSFFGCSHTLKVVWNADVGASVCACRGKTG